KTWKTPGKHGNYPVLLCRASVHDLTGNEYRVNGASTTDWRTPVYEPVGEVSVKSRGDVGEVSTLREVENLKGEKREDVRRPDGRRPSPPPKNNPKRKEKPSISSRLARHVGGATFAEWQRQCQQKGKPCWDGQEAFKWIGWHPDLNRPDL